MHSEQGYQPPPDVVNDDSSPKNNPADFRAPKKGPYREPEFPSDFTEMRKESSQQRAEREVREVVERWGERIHNVIDNWILEDWLREKPDERIDVLDRLNRDQLVELLQAMADYQRFHLAEPESNDLRYHNPASISGSKMRNNPTKKIQNYLKQTEQRARNYPPENFYKNQIINLIINQKGIERGFKVIDRLDHFSDICDKFHPIGGITLGGKPYYDHNWHSFRRLGKNLDRKRYKFLSIENIEQELEKNETVPVNTKDGLIERATQLVEQRASVKKELGDLDKAGNDDISLKAAQRSYQLFLDAELDILAERYGIGDLEKIHISFGKTPAGLPAADLLRVRAEHINMALELKKKITDNEKLQEHRQQLETDRKRIEAELTAIWLLIKDEQNNLPATQSSQIQKT